MFVEQHSVARKKIIEINSRYSFFNVLPIKLKNSYDDVNFYNEISCEDYLIYKLANEIYDKVDKFIDLVLDNRGKYKRYNEEINSLNYNLFDTDIGKYKLDVLRQVNKNECSLIKQTPCIDFKVSVLLIRTNYYGDHRSFKRDEFGMGELLNFMERVQNKNGSFYNDEGVWASLYRVERGKVTLRVRNAVFERDNHRCKYCGRTDDLEVDHIIPIAKGGKTTMDNLQTLCHDCNKRKGMDIY